ncbi:efflux RND transporter permease subunit [Hymenobacter properus]|uniref:Efflux RND transporter permease subunit n=1 Tax=Hymenobacter properus TaxID=2791026 RepID=A0A931BKJ4_9BACT|nr:CusA/CzcA family heavy metal efflux RND transporter [Hymenobacter properus]MBF9143933.1 efflux RND transporter permease subunit [Hymenobacter properus]MBR7722748.1 efflux RND transporter permease subunit [Microvirga sp. SRT04]
MNKFIQGIIAFSLKNKGFVFLLTLAVIIMGVVSYRNTPIEAFPDVTNTEITIITQWPGRSAEEMEKFVTVPIEIALNPVQKKASVRSTTLFGLSVVKVIFDDGVDDAFARPQVNNLLREVDLPDGITPDVQPPYGPTGEIYRYTLESKTKTVRELKTLQDWVIERNLKAVPGVADVNSFGGEVKDYEIAVNPGKLQDFGLTPLDLYNAVQRSNINVGGDVINQGQQNYVVRGIGLLNNIGDINNTVIKNVNGVPILVRDVAKVTESALPRLGQVGRGFEDDKLEGIVVMRKGENPSEVISRLHDKVNELNSKILPPDVKMKTFYDRQQLIDFSTETVIHNLLEGIVLVTLIVFLFMADWRTTVIVSVIIPLALLFAFICLRLRGMSANLLSMGAIDFGIIIDGAVVMVEGLFVALDHKAHELGMERFNKLSKLGLIKKSGRDMGKSIFFAKAIIITALLPIFSFEKVEGKVFSPLAWTLGFALLGALLFTLTLVPVLVSILLKKDVKEKENFFVRAVNRGAARFFAFTYARKTVSLIIAFAVTAVGMYSFSFLGSEFLPELNEGSIYVRAQLPLSISLQSSNELCNEMRRVFLSFPEVSDVVSQTGRPNDGTDPTGFYNNEFLVQLKHTPEVEKEMKSKANREALVEHMKEKLDRFTGVDFNFSQPITDNVEEAASGVKGSIAVKIYGTDLATLEAKAREVYEVLKTVKGIDDLGVLRNIGQPEFHVDLDESRMASYGVSKSDAAAVLEMAVGGKEATQLYEGERKFPIRVRYEPQFRQTPTEISGLMVPTQSGKTIPLTEIATIGSVTGPSLIYRDDNRRFAAVKFSIRGRDMGSTIAEAQEKVNRHVQLPAGYEQKWTGDFENQRRATQRLTQVVPISLGLIFFILFILFGNLKDAGLVLLNVPFAIIGGIAALLLTHTNFSISAGIGFIALFGICIQNGVILISVFKQNLVKKHTLDHSINEGVISRVRPVVMTALMATIGLMPAAISTGIGSETSKPLAIVVIGGLITGTILTLFIFPLVFERFYRAEHTHYGDDLAAERTARQEPVGAH